MRKLWIGLLVVLAIGGLIGIKTMHEHTPQAVLKVDTLQLVQVDTVLKLVPLAPETVFVESNTIRIDTVFRIDTMAQGWPECIVALNYLNGHLSFISLSPVDYGKGLGKLTKYDYGDGLTDFIIKAEGRGFFRGGTTQKETMEYGYNSDLYSFGWFYCHSPDYIQTIGGAHELLPPHKQNNSGYGFKTILI